MNSLWTSMNCKFNDNNFEKLTFDKIYPSKNKFMTDNDTDLSDDASMTSSYLENTSSNSDASVSTIKRESISDLEPLTPEKVRWFYKEKKNWTPFCGYDSLRLETKYRELKYHKDDNASIESLKEMIVVRGDLFEVDVLKREGCPIYWIAPEDEQNSFMIMRGTWFRDGSWQPLDSEDLSDRIENEHIQYFRNVQIQSIESRKSSTTDAIAQHLTKKFHLNIHSVIVNEYHVEWYDESTIYFYTDSASHFIRQRLGLTKVGSKLTRGYKHEARIDDKLPDITHLVFVIHGIGQKMKGGDIVCQVNKLRALSRKVTKMFFPWLESQNHRVEFIPVEWRKLLVLDGNTVDLITPSRNKGFRSAVNSTALDILYYSSPIYRPEMIESLRSELNRLYSMFCSRSPYFEDKGGKASILAHSLGAVLVYDILTNWSPAKVYEYMETLDNAGKGEAAHEDERNLFSELNEAKENVHQLEMKVLSRAEQENTQRVQRNFREANFPSNFIHGRLWKVFPRLENFFCVGSPLAVFLALRGVKPQDHNTIHHILPQELCQRIFNIFHPADPVVYRLEPLVNKMYSEIEPVSIHRLDQFRKTTNDKMTLKRSQNLEDEPIFEETIATRNKAEEGSYTEIKSSTISSKKGTTNVTITDRFMRFVNKYFVKTNTDLLTPLDQVQFLLQEDELQTNNGKLKTRRELLRRTGVKNQSNVSISAPSLCRRGTTISSFRFSKLRQVQGLRQSLRIRREIMSYTNNKTCSDQESSSDDTLEGSDVESITSEGTVFENISKAEVDTAVASEPEPCAPSAKELDLRIDFRLPESRYESSYLSVLTSHTCYWNSGELCQFMLTQIFGHLDSSENSS